MITLFILTLACVGLLFAAMPVVAFALMLETCAERAAPAARISLVPSARRPERDVSRLASAA